MLRAVASISKVTLLSVAMLVAQPATAFNMGVTTEGIHLGGRVSGPTVSSETIANHVVLLEFWGVNCPPCLRSMPMLEELHRTLGHEGLIVIGAHAQGGSAAEIRPIVAKLGVTFSVVEGARVQGGDDIDGIPHCMLFDHTGKCIFRGSPFEVHDAVEAAVKVAPGAVLGGRELAKLPEFNTLLRDERKFSSVLKKAHGLVTSDDAETAEEAKYVVKRIEAYGRRLLTAAVSVKAKDPARASDLLHRCVIAAKGSDVGAEATKLNAEWMKDKQFQAAVSASQQMARLEEIQSSVREKLGVGPEGEVTSEMAATIASPVKARIRLLAKGVIKAAPESALAKKAAAIAAELGVPVGT